MVINNGAIFNKTVTGLDRNTFYEFQVLASTSVGDGPKSSVKVERTKEGGKRLFLFIYLFVDLFIFLFVTVYRVYTGCSLTTWWFSKRPCV